MSDNLRVGVIGAGRWANESPTPEGMGRCVNSVILASLTAIEP